MRDFEKRLGQEIRQRGEFGAGKERSVLMVVVGAILSDLMASNYLQVMKQKAQPTTCIQERERRSTSYVADDAEAGLC